MTADCTYCGSDVNDHDPVFVAERRGDGRESAGRFCNYACLSAHIDEANLVDGACCTVDL
ncbi:hypothetical protein M0R89_10050 [Halorussus limi]|uniref:MYM-type domain-containing protein n=1 Tax=Halorussus limi TaxID=2938695 RepID=A0A8U0HPK7_9EURY|nr:hypothetical protein [Halorussus limi]UPV72890.1 hypothetical protein M0R89_10050 [Halorussus limi]